ncbi:MAG: TonB-dependent receptor [Flavobacteriales bacterium]
MEVIKGPLSILHGSEAVGGVLNLIPEQKAPAGTRTWDVGTRVQSNTHGPLLQVGHKVNHGSWWWGVRAAAESHSDYSDGSNVRVLNSRFRGAYGMANMGFVRKRWLSENYYSFSYNQFGFIFSDLSQFLTPDERWSQSMFGPHHLVRLHIVSSENTVQLRKSTLKVMAGGQSNLRQEDEGGGKLSLQMELLSALATVRWTKPISQRTTLIVANNSSLERNTNYGFRKLVPDAWMKESSLSAYLRHGLGKWIVEYGAGGGWRNIEALPTPSVNSEEKDIGPFIQDRYFANGMAGLSWNPSRSWNLKINSSTGVRAPNLSELSSNGLHEGVYTYELGDPSLKNEQNWNTDFTVLRLGEQVHSSVSVFYNAFHNYIYLKPTAGRWYGFPVYEFVQENATLQGGEAALYYEPTYLPGMEIGASYSGLVGRLNNGDYIPYMPAQQVTPSVRYAWNHPSKKWSGSVFTNVQIVAAQTLTAPAEFSTPAYELLNAGINAQWKAKAAVYDFSVTGKNLLNEAYYDHMSRLKTFGFLNMGRNIVFQLKIKLNSAVSR